MKDELPLYYRLGDNRTLFKLNIKKHPIFYNWLLQNWDSISQKFNETRKVVKKGFNTENTLKFQKELGIRQEKSLKVCWNGSAYFMEIKLFDDPKEMDTTEMKSLSDMIKD